ncbi:MAG: NFACT family protein [Clostridia bacterium]|nr:NFACT family protein [Clostridia bacterium]
MPQDAFTIKYVCTELKKALTGGKISKIVQPSREELTFIIYTANGNVKLDACLSARAARLSLGETEKPALQTPPNFCMLLRKHLQNAEILDVVQPDFERIIYFDLKCVSDFSSSVMRLYFEIMGKYSNAVLTENGVILGALKTNSFGENVKRLTLGGAKYSLPEPQEKIPPDDIKGLEEVLLTEGERIKLICDRVKGIAYATAAEMLCVYGENISAENIRDYVYNLSAEPCVVYCDGEPCDFKVRSNSAAQKKYANILEAQSAYYSYLYEKRSFETERSKLENAVNSAVKKTEKRLAGINSKLLECEGAESIKLQGELITANIYALERGMKCFSAVNYYDPEQCKIKIALDETLTPAQNAQKYYKRYAKLKRTYISVSEQKNEAEQRLNYLQSIAASILSAENKADLFEIEEELVSLGLYRTIEIKKKKPVAPPFREYFYQGFKIVAGRNNLQNERLTKGLAPDDLWLHTQKYHSSHVGIIGEGREVPESVLAVAAEICAYYSDGRGGTKIPVDYAKKKFVKKPPKSNTGFVIYTDYNTVLVDPNGHTELLKD